jgi:pimeloyl-ACP methyl ester carboxylesterase
VVGDSDAPEIGKIGARLVKDIHGAKLVTMANAAHLPNLEHPDEFNAIVLEFLTPLR